MAAPFEICYKTFYQSLAHCNVEMPIGGDKRLADLQIAFHVIAYFRVCVRVRL